MSFYKSALLTLSGAKTSSSISLINIVRPLSMTPSLSIFKSTHRRKRPMHHSTRTQRWVPRVTMHEKYGYTHKPLVLPRTGGRGPNGQVWYFRVGGGLRKDFFMVDYCPAIADKDGLGQEECVERIDHVHDSWYRSAHIALAVSGERKRWIIASANMKAGDMVRTTTKVTDVPVKAFEGDTHPVGSLPVGTIVHCLQVFPGADSRARFVSAAGTSARIMQNKGDTVIVVLPSKREVEIDAKCMATVGQVSNVLHNTKKLGKAGAARHLGRRPKSGLYVKKDGRFGRKIHPPKPVQKFQAGKVVTKKNLEQRYYN